MLTGLAVVALVLLFLGAWGVWAIAGELEKLRRHNELVCPLPSPGPTPVEELLAGDDDAEYGPPGV